LTRHGLAVLQRLDTKAAKNCQPISLTSSRSVPCAQQAPVCSQDAICVYPCASVATLPLRCSASSAISARDGFWRFGVLAVKPFANRTALGDHQIQVRLKLNHREHREHRGTAEPPRHAIRATHGIRPRLRPIAFEIRPCFSLCSLCPLW